MRMLIVLAEGRQSRGRESWGALKGKREREGNIGREREREGYPQRSSRSRTMAAATAFNLSFTM